MIRHVTCKNDSRVTNCVSLLFCVGRWCIVGFYSYFSENSCRLHLKMLVMIVRVVRLNKIQHTIQIKIRPSRSDLIRSMGEIIKGDTVHS